MSESSQYIIVDDTTKHVFEEFEQQISRLFREAIENSVEDNLARTLKEILTSIKNSESLARESTGMLGALLPRYTAVVREASEGLQNHLRESLESKLREITEQLRLDINDAEERLHHHHRESLESNLRVIMDRLKLHIDEAKPDLQSSEKRIIDDLGIKLNNITGALENSKGEQKAHLERLDSIIEGIKENQKKQDKIIEFLQLPWYRRLFTTIDEI